MVRKLYANRFLKNELKILIPLNTSLHYTSSMFHKSIFGVWSETISLLLRSITRLVILILMVKVVLLFYTNLNLVVRYIHLYFISYANKLYSHSEGVAKSRSLLESIHCKFVRKIREDIGVHNLIRIICKKDLPNRASLILKIQN